MAHYSKELSFRSVYVICHDPLPTYFNYYLIGNYFSLLTSHFVLHTWISGMTVCSVLHVIVQVPMIRVSKSLHGVTQNGMTDSSCTCMLLCHTWVSVRLSKWKAEIVTKDHGVEIRLIRKTMGQK